MHVCQSKNNYHAHTYSEECLLESRQKSDVVFISVNIS